MRKSSSKLWFQLVAQIFTVMVISFFVPPTVSYIGLRIGVLHNSRPRPISPLASFILVSLVVATFYTLFIARRFITPMINISAAAKKVSEGDFTIRLKEHQRENQVQLMNTSFNKMVMELSSVETLRNDFIESISHEFKTPLAAIEGYVTLLQDPNLTWEEQKDYTQIILESTQQLSALTGNILKLSKLNNQTIVTEGEEFALDEQIRMALLLLESKWSAKELDLNVSLPTVSYFGDPKLLMQVWTNLIDNAIKFTPIGGQINIQIQQTITEVRIIVSDHGIGMTDQTCERIFDKFFQGDKSRSKEGNGLGLALVKKILELCNGKISVESTIGEGTTFTVSLPHTTSNYNIN